jgi:hypothetical protein
METEAQSAPSNRPRTALLVILGLAVVAFVLFTMRDSAGPAPQTSNQVRAPQQAQAGKLDRDSLDVRLEDLKEVLPPPDKAERNPFRFQPKAPPPPPPPSPGTVKKSTEPVQPPPPTPDPGPPPIPLKFIGVTEAPGVGKIAALTDCRRTVQGLEGEVVEGRYRIVKIGVESLVIEYTDGRGRTTLRMSAPECVTK